MTDTFSLGRLVLHDPRSLEYPVAGLPISSLKSIRWTRRSPILDQLALGSCTGNAAAGWLATDNIWRTGSATITEADAVKLYSEATHLDQDKAEAYPPTDSGSTGLGLAKALKARQAITSYRHAFSLQACLTALQKGPVALGISWHEASFAPAKDGKVSIAGPVADSHEIVLDEIDVANKTAWFSNPWSSKWAVQGRAYFAWSDLDSLLQDQGDTLQVIPPAG
jgi:hypothetical protein